MTTYPRPTDQIATLLRADGTTEAHSTDHGRVIGIWENVKHHGATGGGSVDDTTAIQAAITAAGSGGCVYFPTGRYKFSTLTCASPVKLLGAGWQNQTNVAFGSGSWTGSGTGSVLVSTTTSGAAITMVDTSERKYEMQDLLVLGPGSGTSSGVALGTAAHAVQGAVFRNVGVYNFAKGFDFNFVVDGHFDHLVARGCSTGINMANTTNQNSFFQTEVQFGSTAGINVDTGTANNAFYGGVLQNNTGTSAIVSGTGNHFMGFYVENSAGTLAFSFPAAPAGSDNSLSKSYLSTANDNVTVHQSVNTLADIRQGVGFTVTIGSESLSQTISNVSYTTLSDSGLGTIVHTNGQLRAAQGVVTRVKAGIPVDGDFINSAPATGTIVIDTTNNKIWVRTAAATWKGVVVA